MYNPNVKQIFHLQGQSTNIINGKIIDNNKWKIFSDNGKRFQGKINILNKNKEYKIRDFELKDLSNILENKTNEIIKSSKTRKRKLTNNKNNKKSKNNKKKYNTKKRNKRNI